jgi:Fur family ferric uptake transcriptional regulator
MTRQRQIILQELRSVKTHPSADEIYEMVRIRLPHISLGTVYRNLEILSELGEIQKIEITGKLKRFDGNTHPHYHLRCLNCNRIDDVPEHIHFDFDLSLNEATGYAITGHRLEFVGLCPECSEHHSHRLSLKLDDLVKRQNQTSYEAVKIDALAESRFSDGFVKCSQARRINPEE